jgi:hypothetical protein
MKKFHNCVKNATLHRQLMILCSLEFFFLVLNFFSKFVNSQCWPNYSLQKHKESTTILYNLKEGKKN